MSSQDHFLVHLAGAIASADWPSPEKVLAAQQAIKEMKAVRPAPVYDDAEFQAACVDLDSVTRDLNVARLARVRREQERKEQKRKRRRAQQRQRAQQHRPVPSRSWSEQTKQSAHDEPEMGF